MWLRFFSKSISYQIMIGIIVKKSFRCYQSCWLRRKVSGITPCLSEPIDTEILRPFYGNQKNYSSTTWLKLKIDPFLQRLKSTL